LTFCILLLFFLYVIIISKLEEEKNRKFTEILPNSTQSLWNRYIFLYVLGGNATFEL